MVLLTEHKQSSFEKGTSNKLHAKRYGPYLVKERVTSNCYLVISKDKNKDEKIVNIRQITLFLTKKQQEDLKNEICLQSKINPKDIEEKIREYLTVHEIDDLTANIQIKIDKKSTEKAAKVIASDMRQQRRERREEKKRKADEKIEELKKYIQKISRSENIVNEGKNEPTSNTDIKSNPSEDPAPSTLSHTDENQTEKVATPHDNDENKTLIKEIPVPSVQQQKRGRGRPRKYTTMECRSLGRHSTVG